MLKKPTNIYEHITVSYIINIVCLLHVLATLLTNPIAANCKGRITNVFEPMHKCKILSLKIDGLYLGLYFNVYFKPCNFKT